MCWVARKIQKVIWFQHNRDLLLVAISNMKNLVEQATIWLRTEPCRRGNILDRTNAIISLFREYVAREREEICTNTSSSYNIVNNRIDLAEKSINQILSAFLRGNQQDALQKTREMTRKMKFTNVCEGTHFYRCRENSKPFHFSKDEMFHIPYDKRYLVGNQRFSLSGIPCLYFGGSSYICWEELGRKDFSTINYCGFSLIKELNMFDMLIPVSITDIHQIRRTVLVLACSLAAHREHLFKPEYILPQCVLHSLINRSFYNHTLFCIRYYSSHLLNGDADYFSCDYSKPEELARYVNYVFPAATSKEEGYSEELRKLFNQTDTISIMHETLLNPDCMMGGCSNDVYLDSQFGLIDAIIDKKLGFTPKREDGTYLLV